MELGRAQPLRDEALHVVVRAPRRPCPDAASTPTKPGPAIIARVARARPSAVGRCPRTAAAGRRTSSAGTEAGRPCTRVHARDRRLRCSRGAGRFDRPSAAPARARAISASVDPRAGHRQHQRRRVAEVLDEVDRAGAVRQIADRVELQLDVVELLAGVADALRRA